MPYASSSERARWRMKRRLRRARSEISEHRGKEGDCKKGSWVLDGQGRNEKRREREKENASGCEGGRERKRKEKEEGREGDAEITI